MKTMVTRSGQITIGKELREELEIETGTPLEVNRMGKIIMILKTDEAFWDTCGNTLPKNFPNILKGLRPDAKKRLENQGLI